MKKRNVCVLLTAGILTSSLLCAGCGGNAEPVKESDVLAGTNEKSEVSETTMTVAQTTEEKETIDETKLEAFESEVEEEEDIAFQYFDEYKEWLESFMLGADPNQMIQDEFETLNYENCKDNACFSLVDVNQDGILELLVSAFTIDGNMTVANMILPDGNGGYHTTCFHAYHPADGEVIVANAGYGGRIDFCKFEGTELVVKDYIEYDYDFDTEECVDIVYHREDGAVANMTAQEFATYSNMWSPDVAAKYDLNEETVKKVFEDKQLEGIEGPFDRADHPIEPSVAYPTLNFETK